MSVILLVLAYGIVISGFYRRATSLRESFLYASIPLALFMVFATEGLSFLHALTATGAMLCWMVLTLGAISWFWMQRNRDAAGLSLSKRWLELTRTERMLCFGIVVVVALVGLTALLSAPNTWDAMEYHMPRVVEWISNRGLQLYPTIDRQQLSMPPFSEYTILHLNLLLGSDRLANLVQWMAYVGSALAASIIAREFGGTKTAQIVAAAASATIETGILGASGTKNDYTLSYWIAVSVFLLLRWKKQQSWALTFALGSALSLAVFSKGTAYCFLPPLVAACFFLWDSPAQKKFLLRLPVFALICIAVSGPLWVRNYSFSGSILGLPYFDGAGPDEGRMYGNGHITAARSVANILRNVALNMAVPSNKVNSATTKGISAIIRALGVDPNDHYQMVHSQSGPLPPFNVAWRPASETQGGNQGHFLLCVAAFILFLIYWRNFDRNMAIFAVGIICSFLLYATLLRWSPWNARYQLPVFVLGSAFSAVVLVRVLQPRVVAAITCLMLVLALPLTVLNSSRPLIGRYYNLITLPRDESYFFDNHRPYASFFIQAAHAVASKDCRSIGLDAGRLHFEYPMMALIERDVRSYSKQEHEPLRFSYVAVKNSTLAYKNTATPDPCIVVCLGCSQASSQLQTEDATRFNTTEAFGDILVYSDPVFSQTPKLTQISQPVEGQRK